jgi:hypothetical protein
VVEELKDLQVSPGTRLVKFQLKVKGKSPIFLGGGATITVGAASRQPQLGRDSNQQRKGGIMYLVPGLGGQHPGVSFLWAFICLPLRGGSGLTIPLCGPRLPSP